MNTEGNSKKQEAEDWASLGLVEPLQKACVAVRWTAPTPIQQQAIPAALEKRDIIGLAQTGSGKTGAFALPILQGLLEKPTRLACAVLAPTRELAIQIADSFEALGSSIRLECCIVVGGMSVMDQAVALAKRPHVIVGTPGRLHYHLQSTKGFNLKKLRYLVLDEADRLLNMDFEEEITSILKVLPRDRQTMLFSATMTSKVGKLQRASLRDPVKIEVSESKYETVSTLKQHYLFVPAKYKDCYLVYLLNELNGNTTIVFTHTCNTTMRLALLLRNLGFEAVPLQGKMAQAARIGALNKFKSGSHSILIATDVASRGLDIPAVDLVINYDIPTNPKDYIHRVGRTARAGRSGLAISVVTQYDVEPFQKIERLIGKKMDLFPTEEDTVLVLLERVSQGQRYAMMELKEIGTSGKRKRGEEDDDTEERASLGTHRKRSRGKAKRKGKRK